jgi:hypothetical protein
MFLKVPSWSSARDRTAYRYVSGEKRQVGTIPAQLSLAAFICRVSASSTISLVRRCLKPSKPAYHIVFCVVVDRIVALK